MSVAGQPVLGNTLQEGGVELQLTLLNATTMQPLSDNDNPRPHKGLFVGWGKRHFEPTVRLTTESSYTFRFYVTLLSADIDGDRMRVKVSRTNLAAAKCADSLCVLTPAFKRFGLIPHIKSRRTSYDSYGNTQYKRSRSPEDCGYTSL